MTTTEVDAVINNVYANAVEKGIMNGHFNIAADWAGEGEFDLIGPPSAEEYAKLEELRDSYGWTIYPEQVIKLKT